MYYAALAAVSLVGAVALYLLPGWQALYDAVTMVLTLYLNDTLYLHFPQYHSGWLARINANSRRRLYKQSLKPNSALVIYCHPSPESKSKAAFDATMAAIQNLNMPVEVIDLYAEDFSPVLTRDEYFHSKKDMRGRIPDEVLALQKKVEDAQNIIIIYPVWWYNMPATLKGFFDRVFTAGFAYVMHPFSYPVGLMVGLTSFIPVVRYMMQPYSAHGLLRDKRVLICRTFGGPAAGKRFFATSQSLEETLLRFCGITQITINELFHVDQPKMFAAASEERWLANIPATIQRWVDGTTPQDAVLAEVRRIAALV